MSDSARASAPGFARHPEHTVRLEPCPRRVRVVLGAQTVADSTQVQYMFEKGLPPVYYFPRADVQADLLERSAHHSYCPFKGQATYWHVCAGERRAENALWAYEQPYAELAALADLMAFWWDRVDHWYEEDEEVFVHPRDPYTRIDVLPSSRRVRVVAGGECIADSRGGLFLFETGLPVRYYLPAADVRMHSLVASSTRSRCPYKGEASYWSVHAGGRTFEDAAWCYAEPLPECARIAGYLCFYPERVDGIDVEQIAPGLTGGSDPEQQGDDLLGGEAEDAKTQGQKQDQGPETAGL